MSLLDELKAIGDAGRSAFESATDPETLEHLRIEYLGRSGKLRSMMGRIKEVAKEEKAAFGQTMNSIKNDLSHIFEQQTSRKTPAPSGPLPDPTLPGETDPYGSQHPLTLTMERIVTVFEGMGFSVAEGPEIEDPFHNFDALNIPADHPVREMADTFNLDDGGILRSQTSPVQIRVMESQKPPVRVVAPGRVYRPDTVDATHHYGFSQLEGLAVDTNITFADLKGTIDRFAKELFGAKTKTRFRPSFFPFTEPSAEVDATCIFCGGSGCRVCKNYGWIEIMGCGMVDPNVFQAVGYDPEAYTGYAFGIGIERIAMLTMGIDDIRRFYENDLRFLQQF